MLLLLCAALPTGAAEEDTARLRGIVSGEGFSPVRIAVVGAEGGTGLEAEMTEVVRDDLSFSGYFNVVDPTLYTLVPAVSEGAGERHDDWRSIGAEALLRIVAREEAGRVDLQARLYDNASRALLLARRYGGETDIARRVAHRVSDDLVRHYTGRNGVAMTRIAFVSRHGEGREIYLMDYDGQRIRRLTTTGTLNLSPAWSPSGEELAFVSWRGRQPGIYVMSSEGQLGHLSTVGGELSSSPDWSADGQRLAYSSDVDGNTEIYLLDRARGRNRRLTFHPAIDTAPCFSPNGREIAFTSDRTGSPQIYVMDAEGLNARRVSWSGTYNDSAAWSPDGERLAFSSRIGGRFEIVVLDLPSDRTVQLTSGGGNNEDPRWSPDGRHLVFSSNRGGGYDLYSMRIDGTGLRRLTRGGDCLTPDWSR